MSGIIKPDDVLNFIPIGSVPDSGTEPIPEGDSRTASDLKRALDAIKISGIGEDGAQVDYTTLRESESYQEYRQNYSPRLRNFNPAILTSRNESLAFWINLYNSLVVDAVIALGIQQSVTEGRLGVLTFFRRAAYNIGGYRISLDEIEHGILRGNKGNPFVPGRQFSPGDPRFDWIIVPAESRIHFALNCASRSCPPIQAYTADHLDMQLDMAARNFVDTNVEINADERSINLSQIFQWFKGDFGGQAGVVSFLINHLPDGERRTWLIENRDSVKIRYRDYDWGLNTIL